MKKALLRSRWLWIWLWFWIVALTLASGCASEPEGFVQSSDGVRIVFSSSGAGKPALVLVHGWTNDKSIWDAQVAHFSQHYRVVAIDLPGCGESGDNRELWSVSAFGADVSAVVSKLELDQVVLVGFSLGAGVVIEAAMLDPDRVVGVVIVDALHDVSKQMGPEVMSAMEAGYMDVVTNPSPEKLGPFFRNNVDESYQRVLAMLDGPSRVGWRESLLEFMRWKNEDCTRSLTEVTAPIVAINSDGKPTNVEAFKEFAPSFDVSIIPGVGHVVMWDATDEFNRLLGERVEGFGAAE